MFGDTPHKFGSNPKKGKDFQHPGRTMENQMAYPTDNELLAGFDEGYKDYQRSPFWVAEPNRVMLFLI